MRTGQYKLYPKLPVVLYEPSTGALPKKAKELLDNYPHLQVYAFRSGLMGSEIAKQWMEDVFLKNVEKNTVLIIDSWTGYKQMMQMPEIAAKKLKIVQPPKKQLVVYSRPTYTSTDHSKT